MQVDFERTTADDIVQIGDMNVVVKDIGKRQMVFGKSADSSAQKLVMANDHEASSSRLSSTLVVSTRFEPFSEEEVAAPAASRTQGAGGREAEG